MSRAKEDSYIFCSALMRAGEKTLLPMADLLKAAEAKDFQSAMAVIAEYGYGDGKPLANPRDFIKVLAAEEERVYKFVFSALPEKEELEMLKFPKDYHNAKAILKAEFLGLNPENYLTSGGKHDPEAMVKMIKERNLVFLSTSMKEAINRAIELFGKGQDPQEIDIILDKACYKDMLDAAEKAGNDFLLRYVKMQIDILNISTFVRLRQIGKPVDFFKKVFLEGGEISMGLLTSGYDESYKQLADRFAPYGYAPIFEKGATAVKETGKYYMMEKICDDLRMKYIKDAKYVSFGIEPCAAFLLAKESELKNLRVILTGKIAGTDKQVIIERLRETYV